jgi:hypothetical protein
MNPNFISVIIDGFVSFNYSLNSSSLWDISLNDLFRVRFVMFRIEP